MSNPVVLLTAPQRKGLMIKFRVQIPPYPASLGLEKPGTNCSEESPQFLALPFLAGSLPVASRYLLMISSWVLAEQGWYLEYSMVYSPFPCRNKVRMGHVQPAVSEGILSNPTQTQLLRGRNCLAGIAQLCLDLIWFWCDLIPCCSCHGQDDPVSPKGQIQTHFGKKDQQDSPLCKTSAQWHIQTCRSVAPKIQTDLLIMMFFPSLSAN